MALGDASYGGGQTLGEGRNALNVGGGHRHHSPGVSSDRSRSGHGASHGYVTNSAKPSPFHSNGSRFGNRRGHEGEHGYLKRSAEPSFGHGFHHNRLMRSAETKPGKHGNLKRSAEPSYGHEGHHNRLMRSAETPLGKYGYWKRSAEPRYGQSGHHRLMRSAGGHSGFSQESLSF